MDLSDVWVWYCGERLGDRIKGARPVPYSPATALELLWEFFPMFTARAGAIAATPYDTAFDGDADLALTHLAQTDNFAAWDRLSAGAWRVLQERLVYSGVVVMLQKAEGAEVIGGLPEGLDRQSRARALLLRFLLGEARTIDRRVLPARPDGSLPTFPADTKLRRQ
jgi:hypothetical protein